MAKETNNPQGGEQEGGELIERVVVNQLKTPKRFSITGSIVNMSERRKGDKFKHDTKIVTVEDLETSEIHDVFITFSQWKEYSCDKVIYMGNVVTFSLEECIENVTGYYEFSDSTEMTAHTSSYSAFNRALETATPTIMRLLAKGGSDAATSQIIVSEINKVRQFSKSSL